MIPEQMEETLRRAGRPFPAPHRLRRRVLSIPTDGRPVAWPPALRRRWVAGVAAALLVVVGIFGLSRQLAPFPATTVALKGASGASAEARLGSADGANQQAQLTVHGLAPGTEGYFELWNLGEQPPMLLATFMTHQDGTCVIAFSAPQRLQWRDLVITPRGEKDKFLACSQAERCTG